MPETTGDVCPIEKTTQKPCQNSHKKALKIVMKNSLDANPTNIENAVISTLLLALTVSPHGLHLVAPVSLFFCTTIALKLISIIFFPRLCSSWLIIPLAVLGFTITIWHYGMPLGRDPGVSFLVVLSGLKAMESRTIRDTRIILTLGFFMVVTHFLYSAEFPVVLFLFTLVFAIIWQMIQLGHAELNHTGAFRKRRSDGQFALKMVIQAIPFALILFFLFPRFAGSLWLIQQPGSGASIGMSETLEMGTFTNLVGSPRVAFTAEFKNNNIPTQQNRYWRASVFWDNEGRSWSRGKPFRPTAAELSAGLSVGGSNFSYEIAPASSRDRFMYALDLPLVVPDSLGISADFILQKRNNNQPIPRYEVVSAGQSQNFTITNEQRRRGILLSPSALTSRLKSFVLEMQKKSQLNGELNADLFARNIAQYIQQNEFIYTLKPPKLLGQSPVDEFFFETRRGFCEHYAASFVTLLRAAGIPSRIVVGYLGGEYNPKANLMTVRQQDAHAWAEYWSNTQGWVRIDPTAAIAPERIENGINYNLSLADEGKIHYQPSELGYLKYLLREAGWYSQLAKVQWNRWVVGFDYTRQQQLLKGLGIAHFDVGKITAIAFAIAMTILFLIAYVFHRKNAQKKSAITQLYQDFCNKLAKRGIAIQTGEAPMEFLQRINQNLPHNQAEFQQITQIYTKIKYGSDGNQQDFEKMKWLVKGLKF